MPVVKSFEHYISKVFGFYANLRLLKDSRDCPAIDISKVFTGCFYGSSFRLKSISSIEEETREGSLSKRVGAISDDTIKYGLNHLDIESVQNVWYSSSKRAKRNGMFRDGIFDDYIVGVLDGIEVYSSYNRQCPRCLKRKVNTSKGETLQYYHRAVVLTLVGNDFPVPIGLELMKPGEGEVACALRLLKRIVQHLGKRFVDIVIGDAAYCTPRFFKECEKIGIVPGAVLKENQADLLENAVDQKKKSRPCLQRKEKKEMLKLWDLAEVFWDTADRDVRVVYAARKVWEKVDGKAIGDAKKRWVDKKRVFAFSKRIDHLSASVIYKIGIHRWDIDACLFMDMVKHWHLKHKTLHFENAYENILSIRLISYMLFMFFFHRHINSRRKNKITSYSQMARRLYRSACQNQMPQIILLE